VWGCSTREIQTAKCPLNRKVPATSSKFSKKRRWITLESSWNSIRRQSSSGKEGGSNMEAELIPEGIKISRKLRSDPSVWLLDRSHCCWAFLRNANVKLIDTTNWRDFTYFSNQERMLNMREKKNIMYLVMNAKILLDQDIYGKESVKRCKSKFRVRSARVRPSFI